MLFKLFENLIQWGTILSRVYFSSPGVTALRAVIMGGSSHIPHIDIPHTVLELVYLPDSHLVPVIPNFNHVVRAYPEQFSTLLQHNIFSRAHEPFAQPLPII